MVAFRTAAAAVAVFFPVAAYPAVGSDVQVTFELRDLLDARSGFQNRDAAHLDRFYAMRQGAAAWWTGSDWSPAAEAAVDQLARSDEHGLVPEDYRVSSLKASLFGGAEPASTRQVAEAELRLTRAVLHYLEDVANGRIDPSTVDWDVNRTRRIDPPSALQRGLQEPEFGAWIEQIGPASADYRRLREARMRYADIAELDWPVLPDGPTLSPGDRDPRIATVRNQLQLLERLQKAAPVAARPPGSSRETDADPSGIMRISYASADPAEIRGRADSTSGDREYYDRELEKALRDFQEQQGILVDGQIGPQTRAALNISPADRLEEIDLNLERLRWFSDDAGGRYVIVNVPEYELRAYDGGVLVERTRVIVGKSDWKTPIFSDYIVNLRFAPDWTIPMSIAEETTLPTVRRDPGYLARNNIRVYRRSSGEEISAASVNWHGTSSNAYIFRQEPGPGNALGLVRFSLTNSMGIYLHDTPSKKLFGQSFRALSHGCVRVERPADFAEYLLANEPGWDRQRIEDAMRASRTNVHPLQEQVPIHIVYFTASADETGQVHFRNDVYERNDELRRALERNSSERQSAI